MPNFLLSIIVPVYNEEKNIQPLIDRLLPVVGQLPYEIIFIDDGSRDNTVEEIKKITDKNLAVKLLAFYRNFGHQMALSAGYTVARGDCVVSIDADLQDPPEVIAQMIAKWQKGAKIVYAKREKRDVDGYFKKTSARFFYLLVNFLSDTPIPADVGDFRLLDRQVVEFLNKLPESSRFWRGLVAWGGFPAVEVTFTRAKRHSGDTHYSLAKMLNFAFEGITSFSTKPLYLATYFGFIAASLGFVGIMYLGGVQLLTIGIIGEYIGKIYREVQKRPPYVIEEKVNL